MVDDIVIVDSPTERRNSDTIDIDLKPTREILALINDADATVAPAVAAILDQLTDAVDQSAERVRRGGHVHYFGAGTPGRLAMLDAAEMCPTFGTPSDLVVAHIAGGIQALFKPSEGSEDDEDSGRMAAHDLTNRDIAFGITSSGRTPYVLSALQEARDRGALTILLTNNPMSGLDSRFDLVLAPDTGAEVIAGSTRLKAGTAQKLVLNAYSTAMSIRLGYTWSNLMVSLHAANSKLRGRAIRILIDVTGESELACRQVLHDAGGDVRVALVALLGHVDVTSAHQLLVEADGAVRVALETCSRRENDSRARDSFRPGT